MYVFIETNTSFDNSFTAKAKARQLWSMTKKKGTPKILPQSHNTPIAVFTLSFGIWNESLILLQSKIYGNKQILLDFPEADIAQLTHPRNITTWTLFKNEDESFTQVAKKLKKAC